MTGADTTTARRKRFEALVERAQQMIESEPVAYRVRLGALALLGYLVIFGALFLLLAVVAGSVWAAFASTVFLLLLIKKKLIFVLLGLVYVLIRALWVRVERPQGYLLSAASAPALFQDLNQMRELLELPPLHAVLLTREFNAAVMQTPRLGIFGWQHNTVMLGLPLLLALSADEARAVLAHELGHLSRNHSRFNGWIYRVRASWHRIMEAFDGTQGFAPGMLRRFFDWYAPYFDAMSFALARANEYEADAISVELTSAQATADALVGTRLRDALASEDYWGPLIERAGSDARPEAHAYGGLARFHACPESESVRSTLDRLLQESMAQHTDHSDTHPALRDRLGAIGVTPSARAGSSESAAEVWLGEELETCIETFDGQWLEDNREAWQQRYKEVREGKQRLQELRARPQGELEALELWELASLTGAHESQETALPLLLDYKRMVPEDTDADFVIGRLLLARDDARGLPFMKRARQSFEYAVTACEHLYDYALRAGDPARAGYWRELGEQAIDQRRLAHAERAEVTHKQELEPCGLDDSAMARLREQLQGRPELAGAWVCRKKLQVLPDEAPLFVLAYKPRGWLVLRGKLDRMTAAIASEVDFPGETFVFPLSGQGKPVARRVRKRGEQLL